MSSPLCGTGLYANDVLCEVIANLDQISEAAASTLALSLEAVNAFEESSASSIAAISDVDYAIDTGGVSKAFAPQDTPDEPSYTGLAPTAPVPPVLEAAPTVGDAPTIPSALTISAHTVATVPTLPAAYVVAAHSVGGGPAVPGAFVPSAAPTSSVDAPTDPTEYVPGDHTPGTAPVIPAAYIVPPADQMLISPAVSDDLFDRASDRLTRVGLSEERDAIYAASEMGIGLASPSLLARLQRAQQGMNDKISVAALEQSVQEGVWLREDAKTLNALHVQNWPLKPQLDIEAYKAYEGMLLESYRTGLDGDLRAWSLMPQFELERYKIVHGIEIDSWKAFEAVSVQNWSLKPSLDVEVFKTEEGLGVESYKAETGANISSWPLHPDLELKAYQASESIELDAYKTKTNAEVANWPEHPRLSVTAWQSETQTRADVYKISVDAQTAVYGAEVGGFSAEVQSVLGSLAEESKRFSSRVALLQANIASEGERRGWSQLDIADQHEQASKATLYAIEKIKQIMDVKRTTDGAMAELLVGLTQGLTSAQNYSLSGSGSQRVSESV